MKNEKEEKANEQETAMKAVYVILALAVLQSLATAQEESTSDWSIMPSISVTKLFSVGHRHNYYEIQPLIYPPIDFRGFVTNAPALSATGVLFSARFLNTDFEPLALTLSAGANWHRSRERNTPIPPSAVGGSPRMPAFDQRGFRHGFEGRDKGGFMSFPVSIGAQILFPYEKIDKLMFFAGVEGNLHFLSERAFNRRQVEAGFSAAGGVAIKMFEFGVRYSRFAGQNNIGLQAGIRFNQFEL